MGDFYSFIYFSNSDLFELLNKSKFDKNIVSCKGTWASYQEIITLPLLLQKNSHHYCNSLINSIEENHKKEGSHNKSCLLESERRRSVYIFLHCCPNIAHTSSYTNILQDGQQRRRVQVQVSIVVAAFLGIGVGSKNRNS